MTVEVQPYAIPILKILDELNRSAEKITGPELLSIFKDRGNNTIQSYEIKDAVAILREENYVDAFIGMGPLPGEYGFYNVWITPLGRNYLKRRNVSQTLKLSESADRKNEKKLIFFSYSSKDNKKVGEICEILEKDYKFNVFKAHETIKVTQEWRTKIKENLDNCDGLVAYITRNFRGSEWTYQECGWVAGRHKPIYSLFLMKKIPDGFLEEMQGTRIGYKTDEKEIARKINEAFSD